MWLNEWLTVKFAKYLTLTCLIIVWTGMDSKIYVCLLHNILGVTFVKLNKEKIKEIINSVFKKW